MSDETFDEVVQSLVTLARGGNLAAIKLLLEYTCGKPEKTVEADRLEANEMQVETEATRATFENKGVEAILRKAVAHLPPPPAPAPAAEVDWPEEPSAELMRQALDADDREALLGMLLVWNHYEQQRQSAPTETIADTCVQTAACPTKRQRRRRKGQRR